MATETIVTGKKYRVLKDAATKAWDRISFWSKASDVENDAGNNLETTVGKIKGLADSIDGITERGMAADAMDVSALNKTLGDVEFQVVDNKIQWRKRGADTWNPFSTSGGPRILTNNGSITITKDQTIYYMLTAYAYGGDGGSATIYVNNVAKNSVVSSSYNMQVRTGYLAVTAGQVVKVVSASSANIASSAAVAYIV